MKPIINFIKNWLVEYYVKDPIIGLIMSTFVSTLFTIVTYEYLLPYHLNVVVAVISDILKYTSWASGVTALFAFIMLLIKQFKRILP